MDKKMNEQMTEMTKCVLDNMMRLQEINDRTMQQLVQKQYEAAGDYMNVSVRKLKQMGEAKDMKDVLSNHVDLATELGAKMMVHSKAAMDLITASRGELTGVVEKSLASFLDMSRAQKD